MDTIVATTQQVSENNRIYGWGLDADSMVRAVHAFYNCNTYLVSCAKIILFLCYCLCSTSILELWSIALMQTHLCRHTFAVGSIALMQILDRP